MFSDIETMINTTYLTSLGETTPFGGVNTEGSDECRDFHNQNISDICQFVNETSDCHVEDGFFNYLVLVYCTLSDKLLPLAITLLVCWLVFMFIALAVCADDYFCPSLVVIAKTLRLSDNVAGVTLLAFGNGAPDVFSAIAAVKNSTHGDVGMAFGALLGAGVFITTVVAGSVIMAQPFNIMQRPFLRDVIFFIAAVYATFYILHDGHITTVEAISYVVMYVIYVVVVLVGRFIHQRFKSKNLALTSVMETEIEVDDESDGVQTREESMSDLLNSITDSGITPDQNLHLPDQESMPLLGTGRKEAGPCKEFWLALCPLDMDQWRASRVITRVYLIIKCPALFALTLTTPLVDYRASRHNWNRFINSLHCMASPLFIIFSLDPKVALSYVNDQFPVWAIVLICGAALAVLVLTTSTRGTPPIYHWVFAYVGFVVAVIWIKMMANEIVNVLQTLGVIFDLSNTILGLTLLAWGNSIGDLIADVAMARQGHPRLGISACYGGPLFNLLLGVGIPFIVATLKSDGDIKIHFELIQVVLIAFLLCNLVVSLIVVPFVLKFKLTRPFAGYLFVMYAAFLTTAILVEVKVIRGPV